MPGNIPRLSLERQSYQFIQIPGAQEWGTHLGEGALGDFDFSIVVREPWDNDFKQVASFSVFSSDNEIANDWLTTGNLWNTGNPTWAELRDEIGTYKGLTGYQAIILRLNDWTSSHSTTDCLDATDAALWKADTLAWCQARLDTAVSTYVPEPAPPPTPDPMTQFLPASSVGKIQAPTGLMIAQAARMRMKLDAGRLVMFSAPVPT